MRPNPIARTPKPVTKAELASASRIIAGATYTEEALILQVNSTHMSRLFVRVLNAVARHHLKNQQLKDKILLSRTAQGARKNAKAWLTYISAYKEACP